MSNIYKSIENYYTNKINKYGAIPEGVDWNSEEGQRIRFDQLSKIIRVDAFSISDVGCGYGKYSEYLNLNFKTFYYEGYDLSEDMINKAKELYKDTKFSYIQNLDNLLNTDYSIASGIFNVKMQYDEIEWLSYVLDTLENINKKSTKGFSFNMLTKYSDKEYMRDDLYYADPLYFFDYCKQNFSRNVSLIHDYNLYEFTVLVRKD